MPIDYRKLIGWQFRDIAHSYTAKDCMLYALGLGLGADSLDAQQLRFVYEKELQALPTMAVVLASPGFWPMDPALALDWKSVLHGEQGLVIHRPLSTSGSLVAKMRIEEIVDKGAGKGALLYARRDVYNSVTSELVASLSETWVCRGDGGFGGPAATARKPHELPAREADHVCELRTLPQAALMYRLSGDYNPLHVDPSVAASAGFARPILHGLCTYGIAGYALVSTLCGYDAGRLRRIDVRFTAPVYPGETIRTEIWDAGQGRASFRSRVVERNVVVLNNGAADFVAEPG